MLLFDSSPTEEPFRTALGKKKGAATASNTVHTLYTVHCTVIIMQTLDCLYTSRE